MPIIVTNPSPDDVTKRKADQTFEWDMGSVAYYSSKITVGSRRGSDNIYPGTEYLKGTTKDNHVKHPGGGKTCFARVRFRKVKNGPWCTEGAEIRKFISSN